MGDELQLMGQNDILHAVVIPGNALNLHKPREFFRAEAADTPIPACTYPSAPSAALALSVTCPSILFSLRLSDSAVEFLRHSSESPNLEFIRAR